MIMSTIHSLTRWLARVKKLRANIFISIGNKFKALRMLLDSNLLELIVTTRK